MKRLQAWLLRGWPWYHPPAPVVPPVSKLAEQLPEPSVHNEAHHRNANKIQVVNARNWQIDHEAYARAGARSITEVPEKHERDRDAIWLQEVRENERQREQGRAARGEGDAYLCDSHSPL
jgi:hypothetical protein